MYSLYHQEKLVKNSWHIHKSSSFAWFALPKRNLCGTITFRPTKESGIRGGIMKLKEGGRMALLRTFIILSVSSLLGTVNASDEIKKFKKVAEDLGQELSKFVEDATHYEYLNVKSDLKNQIIERKGERFSQQAVDKITTLFNERLLTVKEMAEYAEEQYKNYTIDYSLSRDNYVYFDVAQMDSNEVKNYGEEFSDKVNVTLNMSVIQTPTDVYQYATSILNSIEWSKKLDEKFKENLNKSKTKYKAWQYIGLTDGVYRSYPGSLWYNDNVKYFDCRQRGWYIEGSSSPKDMVIILDMSGSVIGTRLLIVKLAVKSLLDTLKENDFFNIVYFNKDAHYVKSDWKMLVQATERNKNILKSAMEPLKGKDVANVHKGFSLAFHILKKSKNSTRTTSGCTQTIAFFTDGVEGDKVAEDVFSDYNSEKNIRVFTYLVGREKGSPFKAVKWIACTNKGYFYRIETLSDVRTNIVKYINVLSRSAIRMPKWTPLYLDALGLGMMSALVSPIFDMKDASGKRGKQLGVVGLDIMLEEIMSKIPDYELGAGGYAFSITNNGFVFFHPRLKKEHGINLKNPPSVLLSEVERHFDDDEFTNKLAKAMIDRETSSKLHANTNGVNVLAKYNDKILIVKRKLKYFYGHITNTSFSMAIALTDYGSKYAVPKDNVFDNLDLLNTKLANTANYNIIAAKWPYCNDTVANWQQLKEMLMKTGTIWRQCKNKELMGLLLHDLNATVDWKPKMSANVSAVFFGTTSGLTFFTSKNNTVFETSIRQEYFERAADYWKEQKIVFSAHDKEVRASKAVIVDTDEFVWGVAGVQIIPEFFQNILSGNLLYCSSHENSTCYLVDENGYIIFSEDNDQTGVFFGMVEGLVMKDLIDKNHFLKYNFTDVQGTCETGSDKTSSSVRILDPLFAFVNYVKWWSKTVALSFIQYSFYSIMTGRSQVNAEDNGSATTKSCFKRMDLYIRKDFSGVISNESLNVCEKSYKSQLVDGTNLMLVFVNNMRYCPSYKNKKVTNDAKEIEYEATYESFNKYRRNPEEFGRCLPEAKESEECGAGKSLLPSLILLLLLLQMAIFLKTG